MLSKPEVLVPMPIPDELTDEERAVLTKETRQIVTLHLVAVKASLREAGIVIDDRELTRFGAQLYIEGFRTAVFRKAINAEQLPLPFNQNGSTH